MGGFGSTSGHNFYMDTQNGSKLEVWRQGVLIHTSEFKLWHFEVFPYVCMGKPYVCNVFRPRGTWVGVVTRTYERDYLYPICSKLQYRMPDCILWHTIALFLGIIPSFTVLHTEIGPTGYDVLCGDFRTTFCSA